MEIEANLHLGGVPPEHPLRGLGEREGIVSIFAKNTKVHLRSRGAGASMRRVALLGAVAALPLGLLVASAAQAVTQLKGEKR
jgi:hypothetical protein